MEAIDIWQREVDNKAESFIKVVADYMQEMDDLKFLRSQLDVPNAIANNVNKHSKNRIVGNSLKVVS